ncbi:MAG: sulfatase family protein [Acidimicrobiales bacterium]
MRRSLVHGLAMAGAVLVVAVSCSSTGSSGSSSGSRGSAASGARPNVLFVLTDDMRLDDLQHLPQIRQLIGAEGMTFDDQFDNVTLCCPARTSILRGQYAHNTGVLTNGGTNGGFETAYATGVEQSTLATSMHDAGYTTGLFGKYLNGYPNTASPDYVPPGWDTWSSSSKGNAYGEFNYTLNQNGQQVDYGSAPEDYGTDVYSRQTTDFIDQAHSAGKPFFAYLAVYAPHQPATPAPQDAQAFPGLQAPRDGSYDEADVTDKPQFIQQLPPLGPQVQRRVDALARRRAQSLQAVDRDVAGIVDHLRQTGELDRTDIVFTSDNGFHLGQHRMPAGKQTAYETDIHLPLLVRGPGIAAGGHVQAITGDVDLAPTIADLGGARLTDSPDGRSLEPFLHGRPPDPAEWRQAFLLEHWNVSTAPQDRSGSGQLEPDDLDQGGAASDAGGATSSTTSTTIRVGAAVSNIPEFQGLRVAGYTYVEYATGEKELYDLTRDPDELVNLASSADRTLLAALHQRLEDLRSCRSDGCRSAESAPLTLPS